MGDAAAGAWSMPTCEPISESRWRARRASLARPLCSRASGRSAPRPLRRAKPELKRREACPKGTSEAERSVTASVPKAASPSPHATRLPLFSRQTDFEMC